VSGLTPYRQLLPRIGTRPVAIRPHVRGKRAKVTSAVTPAGPRAASAIRPLKRLLAFRSTLRRAGHAARNPRMLKDLLEERAEK
jgi:hypothetical protein